MPQKYFYTTILVTLAQEFHLLFQPLLYVSPFIQRRIESLQLLISNAMQGDEDAMHILYVGGDKLLNGVITELKTVLNNTPSLPLQSAQDKRRRASESMACFILEQRLQKFRAHLVNNGFLAVQSLAARAA